MMKTMRNWGMLMRMPRAKSSTRASPLTLRLIRLMHPAAALDLIIGRRSLSGCSLRILSSSSSPWRSLVESSENDDVLLLSIAPSLMSHYFIGMYLLLLMGFNFKLLHRI